MFKINKNTFNLLVSYNVLYLSYLINLNNFIIFFNCNNNNISNLSLLNLKNEISKFGCASFSLNRKVINTLFSANFLFLCSSNFTIYINNFSNFINVVKLLNNIKFFFSFKKYFSNIIVNNNIFEEQLKTFQIFNLCHFYFFIILNHIIFFLFYFLIFILNYIKF